MNKEAIDQVLDKMTDEMTTVVHHLTESGSEPLEKLGTVIFNWKVKLEEIFNNSLEEEEPDTTLEDTVEAIMSEVQPTIEKGSA